MKLNDLFKGKTVNIMTEVKVVVQLKIIDVEEVLTNNSDVEHYSVKFDNNYIRTYYNLTSLLTTIVD